MTMSVIASHARRSIDPTATAPALDAAPVAAYAHQGPSRCYGETFAFRTRGSAPAFFDVTDLVSAVVARSGVYHGQVVAATAHTTCALIVQENEPLLLADLADRLCSFASAGESYRHNEMDVRTVNVCGLDECANGHSHCQHALLGATVSLPVHNRLLVLGRWQRLLLIELDHPRPREMTVQVTGVAAVGG